MSRDYVGDMAETVSLLWPKPERGLRSRRRHAAAFGGGRAAGDAGQVGGAGGAGADARPSRRRAAASPCSSWRPARCASASRRGSPRSRWRRRSSSTSMRSRRSGTASTRPICRCSPGPRGGASSRRRATCRSSARSCSRIRSTSCASRSTIMPPSGNGTASASSSSAPAARRGSTAAPATTSRRSFPDVAEAFDAEACSTASCWCAARRRAAGEAAGAASFNALQQRLGRKVVSAKMLGRLSRPSSGSTTSCSTARRICARCPGRSGAPGSRRSCRGSIPARFDLSALIDAEDFEALEEIRAGARDAAIEGVMLKRRDSPYVAGRRTGLWYKWKRDPLTADCVLMYAQRGSGKRSSFYSDYTFGCWTEDGRAAAGRQGLFRLHRRGAEMARPFRAQPHARTASARCARSRRRWCSKSRSIRSTSASATSPASRCASRASPHPHRQAGRRGGPDRDLAEAGDLGGRMRRGRGERVAERAEVAAAGLHRVAAAGEQAGSRRAFGRRGGARPDRSPIRRRRSGRGNIAPRPGRAR